jgi:hypothetical protein
VVLALDLGWTMALLFGRQRRPNGVTERLPTEHELTAAARIELEQVRLNSQIARLAALLPKDAQPGRPFRTVRLPAGAVIDATGIDAAGRDSLRTANLHMLEWLACAGREYSLAYQLGRSLRDTANPPLLADGSTEAIRKAVLSQLSRERVAKLQEWLSVLVPYLPPDAAAIVSASMGRWCDLVTTTLAPGTPGKLRTVRPVTQWFRWHARGPRFRLPSPLDVACQLYAALLTQGDAWLNLLVGAESAAGLLTPEGFVAAGEAALSRTARIIRKIAYHYWFILLIIAAAAAAAIYFAARDLTGAGRLWTQIGSVAAALGVTTRGIATTMARLSRTAEAPIFGLEKIDAMAWAVTTFPDDLKLDNRGIRALRRSGIPGSSPLGRV